ncbi:MAG TPA: TolC family protein [Bacteroidales bacterium]|nr:TolC family protein [Bacteroidales bacterium]
MKCSTLLNKAITITFLLIVTATGSAFSQIADSLSLEEIIDIVIKEHPSVNIAQEAVNNAKARIGLARTGYNPEVDLSASYSYLGPVTKISIPDMGSFQLFPENNYSAAINYRQVIFDFGRTRQNIALEKENMLIGEQALEQTRQKLSMLVVNNYFTLVYLQSAIRIKDEQLKALNEHLNQVLKMKETGSATDYLVLSTKVKISAVEGQKVDLEAALEAQKALLISLLGDKAPASPVVKTGFSSDMPVVPADSVLSYAFNNRDEVKLNEEKAALAALRYDLIKLQNKPLLSINASGGAKNGYLPYLGDPKVNYVVGLGLRVPIFDGMKNKYNLLQAKSAIESVSHESELTKRTVTNELSEARAYMAAAETKMRQFMLQMEQAQKAYSLALTSFSSGVITNLDLLDANTAVSESRLYFLKARIDYAASIYKFRAALGERLY